MSRKALFTGIACLLFAGSCTFTPEVLEEKWSLPKQLRTSGEIVMKERKGSVLLVYSWDDVFCKVCGREQNNLILELVSRDGNEKRHRKGDKDGFSVVNGELICHQDKGRVVFVDRFNPGMEIWSLNGTLLRKIGIDEAREAHFKEVEIGGVKDFYWLNEVPSCFASGSGNASTLALAYHNAAGESCIFIMDWEGQMLQSFQVPGKVLEISISSRGDYVDCWTAFPAEDCLVRYPL